MGVERKVTAGGTLKAVDEGKAHVRLATLLKADLDNDVIEHNFFPTAPPLKVSIQPYHNHLTPSLGHAIVWEDTAKGEIMANFEFNDSLAAQEQWRVLKWDLEHGPIQEFSWAFRVRPGAARQGMFEGKSVRFLGPAADGGFGVDLIEAGPVLRGASINSGTLAVRGLTGPNASIGPDHPQYAWLQKMYQKSLLWAKISALKEQVEAQRLHEAWRLRQEAIATWRR